MIDNNNKKIQSFKQLLSKHKISNTEFLLKKNQIEKQTEMEIED